MPATAAAPKAITPDVATAEVKGTHPQIPSQSSNIKHEDYDMERLVHDMRYLQTEINHMRQERDAATESARFANVEAERLRASQQGTYANTNTYSRESHHSKHKTSDLPKFYGKDTEDVDDWIEKISAITTYSGARDSELLRLLPLLLQGNASEWFTTLGEEARGQLNTWELWKSALRNAFYLPDHEMRKRMMCRNRMLRKNETFGDYFQARRALQRYLYPEGTPDKILIQDILEGIPIHLHPIIRANSIEVRTIDQFRRVLIDLEPGIRDSRLYTPATGRMPYTPRHNSVNNINASAFKPSSRRDERSASPKQKTTALPPSPCRCGKMHWYRDCPEQRKKQHVNFVQRVSPATFPNNTPPVQGKTWRPWNQRGGRNESVDKPSSKDVNSIQTRSKRGSENRASSRPPVDLSTEIKEDSKEDQEICPTYASARLDNRSGQTHRVCIDTGSSISVIDYDYARRYLPASRIKSSSSLRLLGVGSNTTTGSVEVDFHFVCQDSSKTCIKPVVLHVVPRLNTKIILGNDYLVPLKAQVNLTTNTLKFGPDGVVIPLSSMQNKEDHVRTITARTREAFIIEPRSQARIPIVLYPEIEAESYFIKASQPTDDLFVARSIAKSNAKTHFAMLCNPGECTVRVPAGTLIGYPQPMNTHEGSAKRVNNIDIARTPGPTFEEEIAKLDINPELTTEQQEDVKNVIRRQHTAFAYGDRKLGRTDLAIMKIDTGDAAPISQPPYHASPAGRKIIDDTLAELIAEDVIQESDSPWASPAILVHQKGKDRFCIDFRKINEVTKADQYPIPRIDDILSQFAGKQYFSTFDANKGFHQIEIDAQEQEKLNGNLTSPIVISD